jgi:transposase, IS5 family
VDRFGQLLDLALRVRHQEQRQRGSKSYSLREPEAEYIGKGKARAPYEFGFKVWITTPATTPKGGQFVPHAKALHRSPYDGHTLGPVIADLEKLTGAAMRRIHGDKRYRGHNYPNRFKVWIRGQVRGVTKAIRRKCVAAPPSSRDWSSQDHHRMRRNYLKGRDGDRSCSLPLASTSGCFGAGRRNCYCVSRYGSLRALGLGINRTYCQTEAN